MTKKRGPYLPPKATVCDWCGQWTNLVYVHGHYQCGSCARVLIECCEGEIEMAEEPKFIAHYTVYVETGEMTKDEAARFPVKLMQAVHHIFPGLKVQVTLNNHKPGKDK